MRVLRISNADVATHAFGIAFAGEHSEGECHMLQHPLAMGGEGRVLRYAGERDTLGYHLQWSLFLLDLVAIGLFAVYQREGFVFGEWRDSGRRHLERQYTIWVCSKSKAKEAKQ